MINNLRNKKIIILGLGRSGLAAAQRLVKAGAKVFASDTRPETSFEQLIISELREQGVVFEFSGHSDQLLAGADLIVVSPGLQLDIPILEQAKTRGIPIISEIELAYYFLTKPIIAVTGTNGKTTTTTLIGEFLQAAGKKIAVAGNIGNPLVAVDDSNLDYIVAEISSYQLETTITFKPWISLILNIQPDHLARHGSIAEYIRQKAKIFANQTGDDYLIYNLDDPQVVEMVKTAAAKKVGFSKSQPAIITLNPQAIKIPGRHNLENALSAASVANLCGVSPGIIAQVLRTFSGVEHRIEFVARFNDVEFYNDSKATNPDSTLVALETFVPGKIILILGGQDKGTDLSQLARQVKASVKAVVLLGEARQRFSQALSQAGFSNIQQVGSIDQAVNCSFALAQAGDIVLLSPACASFDMFTNFEERGKVFKQAVQTLKRLTYAET